MVNLKTFFDRSYCVNLDRRKDRWETIQRDVVPVWPFAPIERWSAVDGQKIKPPAWWRISPGAWGCYRSHVSIVEQCLRDEVKSVLVVEDDITLHPDIAEAAEKFLEELPADWDMIYFGGRLWNPKEPISEHVARARGVMLTHSFAMSASGLQKVYDWLHPMDWRMMPPPGQHVDFQLGRHHRLPNSKIYVPNHWFVIQTRSKTDIQKWVR